MLSDKGGAVTGGLILLFAVLAIAAPPADRPSHKDVKRSAPSGYDYGELQRNKKNNPKRTAPLGYGDEILHVYPTVDPKRTAPLGYGDEILHVSPTVDPKRTAPLGYEDEMLYVSPIVYPKRTAPLGYGDKILHVSPTVDPKRTAPLGYGEEILHVSPTVDPKRTAPLGYGDEILDITPTNSLKRTAPVNYDKDSKRRGRQFFINYVPHMFYTLPLQDSQTYNPSHQNQGYDSAQARIGYGGDEQDEMQYPQQSYIVPAPIVYFMSPQSMVSPLIRSSPQFYVNSQVPRQQIVNAIQGYVTQAANQAVGFVGGQASGIFPITLNVPDIVSGVVNRFTNGYQYVQQTWQNRPAFLRPTTTTTPRPVTAAVSVETNPQDVDPDPLEPEKVKPAIHEFGPL